MTKSKSASGLRDVAIPPVLADALFEHRGRSHYQADGDFVFCHPEKGTRLHADWYGSRFKAALVRVGITEYVRPHHDLRDSAITNLALEAKNAATLQQTAGHASIQTTQGYMALAGQRFPEEAAALESRYGFALIPASEDE